MDGRWKWCLAGGVLFGLAGCSRPFTRHAPPGSGEGPLASATRNRSEEPRESLDKNAVVKTETLLALADVKLNAGRDPNKSSRDRDKLLSDARMAYQGVLERQPTHLVAMVGLAKTYIELGNRERALELYRRAAEGHPQEPGVWYEMGLCQGQTQDWESASQSFGEASRLDPDNRTYRTWLGFTLARLGRSDEAFAWLRKGRNDAEARYLLAKVMLQSQQEEAGRKQLALALQADPRYGPAAEMLAALNGSDNAGNRPEVYPAPATIQAARFETPVAARPAEAPGPQTTFPLQRAVSPPTVTSPQPIAAPAFVQPQPVAQPQPGIAPQPAAVPPAGQPVPPLTIVTPQQPQPIPLPTISSPQQSTPANSPPSIPVAQPTAAPSRPAASSGPAHAPQLSEPVATPPGRPPLPPPVLTSGWEK